MSDEVLTPKFSKKQVIRISLYNDKGKIKNELARKALPYYAQVAEIMSVNLYEQSGKPSLVYRVKMDDGTLVNLTEDCLMPINDQFSGHR
jgi:hypothetical protein